MRSLPQLLQLPICTAHPLLSHPFEYGRSLPYPRTDIVALNGGLWCSESQSDILVPSSSSLSDLGGLGLDLGVQEDVRLLLESALRLYSKFGGHGCGGRVVANSLESLLLM